MKTICKKRLLPLLVILLLLLPTVLGGCVGVGFNFGSPAVRGNGNVERRDITPGDFTGVYVGGGMEIVYTKGDICKAEMEMDENLFEHLDASIKAEDLNLSFYNINVRSTKMILYVTAPSLDKIRISGAASFVCNDPIESDSLEVRVSGAANGTLAVDVDRLRLEASGAADLDLEGRADDASVSISGAGKVYARDLISKYADMSISGSGEMTITCEDELSVQISGAGTVNYYGSPTISQRISGAGSIVQKKS